MPQFRDIIGQSQLIQYMQTAIQTNNVSHAYIISGEKSSGKEFISRVFVQALVCEKGEIEPCNECHACKQAMSDNHPDVRFISHEKPASYSVDEIREQISADVSIRPYSSSRKIYVIPEAEKMTPQAQNALLKTLEEPPEYVVIILLTSSLGSLLQTIRSRCVELDMKPVPKQLLKDYLMEEMQIPDYRADVCVAFAQGNFGRAKQMAASDDFSAVQAAALGLVKNIRTMETSEQISVIKSISEYKVAATDFLDIITIWYRDVLLFKASGDANEMIFREELSTIRRVAARCSYEGIEEVLEALEKAKNRLRANVNFDLTMELLVMTIRERG